METLHYHEHFCPKNDVIFATLFGDEGLFTALASAVTGEQIKVVGQVHTQAEIRGDRAELETIRFDTFAQAEGDRFYTMDIQRAYKEARLTRRTVYYACKAISAQRVRKMAYEELKPVNISFIYTDHDEDRPVRHIKLCDTDTSKVYDDLIELTLVYVPAAVRAGVKADGLYVFARFFDIGSQKEGDEFAKEFGSTQLGKELIRMYNNAVKNSIVLDEKEQVGYFFERLTEAEMEEEREIALQKGIQKGLQEGLQKGRLLGLEQARAELLAGAEQAREQASVDAVIAGVRDPAIVSRIGRISIERATALINEYTS
ncbi:hypothetical protein AGMMS49992_07310 [Clostridia bacterium]|nr:hypothetical protein AGMMS49992_07310 [Clostridia bacterium]